MSGGRSNIAMPADRVDSLPPAGKPREGALWRDTSKDLWLVLLTCVQPVVTVASALRWHMLDTTMKIVAFAVLALVMTYNILIVAHLFVHRPWFRNDFLNRIGAIISSLNIGQSVEAYRVHHCGNHHRWNNDRADASGNTRDETSTFRGGVDGEHLNLFRYAFVEAFNTLFSALVSLIALHRRFDLGPGETLLRKLAKPKSRQKIRVERALRFVWIVAVAAIDWRYAITCYVAAWFVALVIVNVQNYFEHFGANPDDELANSVSYYGRLYNLFTFNDGYHQEHHLAPSAHWTALPNVLVDRKLDGIARVVSRWPGWLGFLDDRPLLHRAASKETKES